MKKAFITGITGQDGSYLAEFLLAKGYEIHGLIRRASTFNTDRIDHLYKDLHDPDARIYLHYGDLSVSGQMLEMIHDIRPDEIYHLGAQSHVRVSFDMPEYTSDVTGLGTLRLLEAIRRSGIPTRFYQASSSEMFGAAPPPQSESTLFQPQSPYACAKVYAYYVVRNYRDAYKIFAANGILFNHESPRRGETFVTRKITRAATRIKLACRTNFIWAISTPSGTGDMRATTSRPCGSSFSRSNRTTMRLPQGRHIRSGNSPRGSSRNWTSISTNTWPSISAISVRLR